MKNQSQVWFAKFRCEFYNSEKTYHAKGAVDAFSIADRYCLKMQNEDFKESVKDWNARKNDEGWEPLDDKDKENYRYEIVELRLEKELDVM